jgi:tripartite-type tricarboxylate transporter receptor subunit TctC
MYKKFLLMLLMIMSVSAHTAEPPPVRLLIGYVAGSNSDKIARVLQRELIARLNRNVIVEYKPGAGGDVAVGYVANNTQAETTLLLTNINVPWWNINKNPNYNYKDLVPVAYLGYTPMVLVCHPSFPYHSFGEWKSIPENRPITFGSSGIGAGTHLGGEVLMYTTRKNMLHVPYKGSGQMMPDLLAGRVETAYSFVLETQELVRKGQLIPLVVAADRRVSAYPDVPTLNELGLKDSWLKVWQILVANPGADPEVVAQVQQALQKLYQDPDQRAAFAQATDLQLDPDRVILSRSFLTEQIKHYQNLSKKISTFNGQ